MTRFELVDRGPLKQRELKQGGARGSAALGMKRVSRLAQQDDPRNPERRGRAKHGAHILRVLKRDEKRAPFRPGLIVRPGWKRGHVHEQKRRAGARNIKLLEKRGSKPVPDQGVGSRWWTAVVGDPGRHVPRLVRQDLGHDPRARNQRLAVLANPSAPEQLAKVPEAGVRFAGQLAHLPLVLQELPPVARPDAYWATRAAHRPAAAACEACRESRKPDRR